MFSPNRPTRCQLARFLLAPAALAVLCLGIAPPVTAQEAATFNYDEAKVPQYDLPSVLGPNPEQATQENWPQRRQAILEQFREHVYGYRPEADPTVTFRLDETRPEPSGGKIAGSRVICQVTHEGKQFEFPFVLYTPANASGKVPLVIYINIRQPQSEIVLTDEAWPHEMIVEAGFATAMFNTWDVDPDRADGYEEGLRGFLADNEPRGESDWGSLSAWGWAASRVLDFAATQPEIDASRVALVGHSRGGKTALWAAAEDPRFSVVFSNESGCGGAALSRRRFGETVARICSAFPHWFAKKFTDYSGNEDALPVDQHQLIGLIAPRAVYVASAAEDLWADPRGEYLSLVHAAPVYRLLGQTAITDPHMPPLEEPRIVGRTGYHIRGGAHRLTVEDWARFLKFAQLQFAE